MNEIAKESCKEKIRIAIKKEGLTNLEASQRLGLRYEHLSYINNPKFWGRIGDNVWDKVLAWVNSGKRLREYSVHPKNVASERDVPGGFNEARNEADVRMTEDMLRANDVLSDYKTSICLDELGLILADLKEGNSVLQVSVKHNIHQPIIELLSQNVVSNKKVPFSPEVEKEMAEIQLMALQVENMKASLPVCQTVRLDIEITINGQKIKML